MKSLIVFAAVLMIGALPLSAEMVEGILMDKACSGMVAKKGVAAAESHGKDCALMDSCKSSGFGVVTKEGKFLKFDAAGDKQAVQALEQTSKENNITVTVDGQVSGDNIKVKSLKIT